MAATSCPRCGLPDPPGHWCVRCGQRLGERAGGRSGFAAAPHERLAAPRAVSTLFPRLPRADMRVFQALLLAGVALSVGCAAASLLPIAVLTAAVLMPVLAIVYFSDVDIYEGEPVRVLLLTMVTGAAAGFGLALAANALSPPGPEALVGGEGTAVLVRGAALPLAGLAAGLAGPLLLLRHERFNDVLDGVTFGVCSAACLASTQVATLGVALLDAGVQHEAAPLPWIARAAALAVGAPLLAMATTAVAAAALWLRYRSPVADRRALGLLGRPLTALPLAALLAVLGPLAETVLPAGLWLLWLAALDLVALYWLRRAIDLGLRQELAEIPVGPPIACANCGVETPRHSFCANCGVSLRALPKDMAGGQGTRGARIRPRRLVAVVAAVGVSVGTLAAGAAAARETSGARCPARGPCAAPPARVPAGDLRAWRSAELGLALGYPGDRWRSEDESGRRIDLVAESDGIALTVEADRADRRSPRELLDARVRELRERLTGMAVDDRPEHRLLGPDVGLLDGVGEVYAATVDTPQGVGNPVGVVVMAAGNARVSVAVAVVTDQVPEDRRLATLGLADSVLDTLRLPAAAAGGARRTAPARARAAPSVPVVQPDASVNFSLVLRTAHERALRRRLGRLGEPGARPLDPRTFGRRFGPSPSELARVRRAVRAAGMQVTAEYPQRTQIDVRGRAREARRLFGPRLGRPIVPPVLTPTVTDVAGPGGGEAIRPAAVPAGGLRPRTAASAYGIDRLRGRGLLGQGERVAIVSFDSFHHEDVDEFDRRVGIGRAPRVKQVPVAGGVRPGPRQDEVNLDIDMIRGVAPGAQILNYEAERSIGFAPILNRILADGDVRVVSISWGACELRYARARRRADARALAALAATGVSVFVATGDSGAADCERFDPTDHRRSVSWPSSSAQVVAVGGTLLDVDGRGRYAGESGWEDVLSNAGGGGGLSRFERRQPWQRSAGLRAGVTRATPDVAASADPDSGWFVWFGGQAHQIGGTSAAAPFWAGSAVLAHQAARAAGRRRPPFLAPLLYRVARAPGAPFHDVVSGGNRLDAAGPGWDHSTGLGSPDVGALIDRLVRALPARDTGDGAN